MPTFTYQATDEQGNAITGTVEAATLELAQAAVRDKGFADAVLTEQRQVSVFESPLRFWQHIPLTDKVIFSRQLSVLIGAKVPLVTALRTVGNQTASAPMREVVQDLAQEVEGGAPLSAAMSHHPKVFPEFASNLVASGESTGRLDEVLNYMADQQEKDYDLKKKVQGAMFYPAFIVSGLLVVGIIMMVFVIPKLTGILTESGGKLPFATRLLVGTSKFFVRYTIILIGLVVAALVGFRFSLRLPEVRRHFDHARLRAPVFGGITRRMALVRFSRSMRTLLDGGVDVPSALRTSADVVGNSYLRAVIKKSAQDVADGHGISASFSGVKVIPKMVPQMMSVGEETGKLGEILGRLAEFYTREIDAEVAGLVTVIEPIIIVIIGAAVGFMVAAIIMPMYQLANQF